MSRGPERELGSDFLGSSLREEVTTVLESEVIKGEVLLSVARDDPMQPAGGRHATNAAPSAAFKQLLQALRPLARRSLLEAQVAVRMDTAQEIMVLE